MGINNYIVIQGWMCSDLKLKGNDLLIFALIHGFSQDGESYFRGSRKYIAETFNISLPTVDKSLNTLIEHGLIQKDSEERNGITFNHYRTLYPVKKLYTPSKETLHNNIEYRNRIFDNSNKLELSKEQILQDPEIQPESTFQFGKKSDSKKGLYSKCVALIHEYTQNPKIIEKLIEYLNFRLSVKDKPLYTNMWKGLIRKLQKMSDDEQVILEIIDQSIERGYLAFYQVKQQYNSTGRPSFDRAKFETYTTEEKEQYEREIEERRRKGLRVEF